MEIQLNPKYNIGTRIEYQVIEADAQQLMISKIFIITDIKAIYDFKQQKTIYSYELSFEDLSYVYGWVTL